MLSNCSWPSSVLSIFSVSVVGSASKLKKSEVHGGKYHLVLQGAAQSDFPDITYQSDVYDKILCPVLLLTIEGDASHPVSTAVGLHQVLPNSELHIAADKESASREWPQIIASFLLSLQK